MNHFRLLKARLTLLVVDESGMSTVEYAIGTIAAAAFGAILYTVVTGRLDRERAEQHHHQGAEHQQLSSDAGGVTVEAALAIASLVTVLVLAVAALAAMVTQVGCVDSAREAGSVGRPRRRPRCGRRGGPAGARRFGAADSPRRCLRDRARHGEGTVAARRVAGGGGGGGC